MFDRMNKNLAVLCATLVMVPCLTWAGGLSVNRSALMPGETLEVTYKADAATTNNVYFAVALDDKLFFLDGNGTYTLYQAGVPTPARLEKPAAGTYKVLTYTAPQNFKYDLSLYVAEAAPGADVLAGASGVNYQIDTRRSKSVTFMDRPAELDRSGASASKGATLYQQHCYVCHNDPQYNLGYIQRGVDPKKTLAKNATLNAMKYLKNTLSSNDAIDIAAWLATAR